MFQFCQNLQRKPDMFPSETCLISCQLTSHFPRFPGSSVALLVGSWGFQAPQALRLAGFQGCPASWLLAGQLTQRARWQLPQAGQAGCPAP
uniref:Uncharacterized protein n=1 Tax=Terrapene triunguis TaxID=2587831 RepID=A0A674IWI0_9SAUR